MGVRVSVDIGQETRRTVTSFVTGFCSEQESLMFDVQTALREVYENCRKHGKDNRIKIGMVWVSGKIVVSVHARSHRICRRNILAAKAAASRQIETGETDLVRESGRGILMILRLTKGRVRLKGDTLRMVFSED